MDGNKTTSLWAAVGTATTSLHEQVKKHPYGTLAAAVGAGYVLGGGLFTRLTARMVKLGVRTSASLAALPVLASALLFWGDVLEQEGATRATSIRSRSSAGDVPTQEAAQRS